MAEPAKDRSMDRVAMFVRIGVLAWSGAILTTSYLNLGKPSADLTFPASVFSAALASFGIERNSGTGENKKPPAKTPRLRKEPDPFKR